MGKFICTQSLESVDFDELMNVIPLHWLLTFLVHQLPEEVPTLADFNRVAPSSYLEGTLIPLWDEQPAAVSALKTKIAELCDRHNLDPTESTVVAFIMAQTG